MRSAQFLASSGFHPEVAATAHDTHVEVSGMLVFVGGGVEVTVGSASDSVEVYLEVGKKRVFAGALDWPGWCRSGRDESAALQSLLECGPRYERILRPASLGFRAPSSLPSLVVAERLEGNPTTDFGAPALPPAADTQPVDARELDRFRAILEACWRAFDVAVGAAAEKELRKGPRGGGREREEIVQHLRGGDAGYLTSLGWKQSAPKSGDLAEALSLTRKAILEGLAAAAGGQIPSQGPRGGQRWTPRYFVRRVAWHALDHAWEIEDRLLENATK